MSLGLCQYENNKSMCAYCSKKEECSCRCDKNTDVIWGEITGELKDQTDLQAALDKCIADILTTDTLAHTNENRLDIVTGTANESNQRSKDNLLRLDIVQGTADAAKVLADKNNNELATIKGIVNNNSAHISQNETLIKKVEATANEADALSKEDRKLIDTKSDIGHTHSQISNGSTVISTTENKAVITALQTEINSRNGRVVWVHSGNSGSDSYINLMLENGGTVYLSLNGVNVGDELKLFDQMAYRFDLIIRHDDIKGGNKFWLPKDFCTWIAELYNEYIHKGEGDGYDGSKLLMTISGAQIHVAHQDRYRIDGEEDYIEHQLHFKPWTLVFYQKITEYTTSDQMRFVPILEIEVGDDASKYMEQINGLSDVKYLRIDNDNTNNWLFINSNNEQVGSFTIQ